MHSFGFGYIFARDEKPKETEFRSQRDRSLQLWRRIAQEGHRKKL